MGLCLSISKNMSKLDERTQLKSKKRKVDKAAIGLPTNFQHVAHGGADGSTTHPGTTRSQLDALKNKMNDFAKLLDDFDGPVSPTDLPSTSAENLIPNNNEPSVKDFSPDFDDSTIKVKHKSSQPLTKEQIETKAKKHATVNGTLHIIPTRSKPSSRQSIQELFESFSEDIGSNLLPIEKQPVLPTGDQVKPDSTVPYLDLPLGFEEKEGSTFSNEVDGLFQAQVSDSSTDPSSNQPLTTEPRQTIESVSPNGLDQSTPIAITTGPLSSTSN